MKPTVLTYSKDPDFVLVFGHILSAAGFDCQLHSAGGNIPDHGPVALVLDCQAADRSVVKLCDALKSDPATSRLPIVALLAPKASGLHIDLIKAGADEIFQRPFAPDKLITWLETHAKAAKTPVERMDGDLVLGDFMLERRAHRILFKGAPIAASPIEFKLLRCLMATPGAVLSRAELIAAAWPDHAGDTDIRGVDVQIARLRKSLRAVTGREMIRTVRSAGYAFAPDW